MNSPRFYVPEIANQEIVSLTADDAKHAKSVLRLRSGDRVILFDGVGLEAEGEIISCGRSQVAVAVALSHSVSREVSQRLELFVSLPKGDRQKQMIDMLVQLGVHALSPLVCQRSVAHPTDTALDRLRRSIVESSKQCGRNQLMQIGRPTVLSDLCRPGLSFNQNSHCLFAHPYGSCRDLRSVLQSSSVTCESTTIVLVGPEGGFSEAEVQRLLDSHWFQFHLGPRVLRIETAAVSIAAAWAIWNEQSQLSTASQSHS